MNDRDERNDDRRSWYERNPHGIGSSQWIPDAPNPYADIPPEELYSDPEEDSR